MNTTRSTTDIRPLLSSLWTAVMCAMAFADIFFFITPGSLKSMVEGTAGMPEVNDGLLAAFALLTLIPILMIVLSRVLPRRANRVAQPAAAALTILWVVGGGSLSVSYILFASAEVILLGCAAVLAVRRLKPEPARPAA